MRSNDGHEDYEDYEGLPGPSKVCVIHCGSWPNVTAYRRVILGGERYFMLAAYGKSKLYRPNRETRCMDYVGRA